MNTKLQNKNIKSLFEILNSLKSTEKNLQTLNHCQQVELINNKINSNFNTIASLPLKGGEREQDMNKSSHVINLHPLPLSAPFLIKREATALGMREQDKSLYGIGNKAIELVVKGQEMLINEETQKINRHHLRLFTNKNINFNADLATYQSIFYHFNKSNKTIIQRFINASNVLKLSFLAMGCLISKPIFKIVYTKNRLASSETYKNKAEKKIIIKLFYFVRYNSRFSSLYNTVLKLIANPNIINTRNDINSKLNIKEKELLTTRLGGTIEKDKNFSYTLDNIQLFERKNTFFAKNALKFEYLASYLSKLFGSEIQLDIVRLYKPHYDGNILVQHLNLRSFENRFYGIVKKLFKTANISNKNIFVSDNFSSDAPLFSSILTGIKIKLGGRSFQQKIIPRKTVQQIQRGSLSRAKVKYVQTARFTSKVRRGSYSFTVTLGHSF